MAFNTEIGIKIAAAGAIPPLVTMLGAKRTAEAREAAAGALENLTARKDNSVKVAASGAIPLLVALLGAHSTEAMQAAATGSLRNIANNANDLVRVAAYGAIPPLVALLGTRNTAVQYAAAEALWNLTNDADNKVKAVAAGAIPPLVALLGADNTTAVQEVAAGALRKLALNSENLIAIKSDPRALSSLSKLQSTSASTAVRQAAERTLQVLNSAPFPARRIHQGNKADKHANGLVAAEEEVTTAMAAAAVNKRKGSMTATQFSSMPASPMEAGPSQQTGHSQQTDHSQQAGPSASAPATAVSCASTPISSVAATMPPTAAAAASQQLPPPRPRKSCWSCGATGVPLKKCSVCAVAAYCGADCQKADWKAHKGQCAGLKAGASGSGSSAAVEEK